MKPIKTRRARLRAAALGALCALLSAPIWAQHGVREEGPVVIDGVDGEVVDAEVVGGLSHQGGARLMGLTHGDFNGDGLEDLAIGAPGYDPNGLSSAGSVFVLYGDTERWVAQRPSWDLSPQANFDVRFDGAVSGEQLGTSVAAGDVNGDGVDDLVMSASGRQGRVVVRFGGAWPSGPVVLEGADSVDLVLRGNHVGSFLGASLCVGRINPDKMADMVIGGIEFDASGAPVATALYVVPGRPSWSAKSYRVDDARLSGTARLVRALGGGASALYTCEIGDFDQDGAGDIVAGMPLERVEGQDEVGSVSVVYDVLATGGTVDLGKPRASFGSRIIGDQAGARFGSAVLVGDFNSDGRDDLVVGAPRRLVKGPASEGAAYVFWGGALPEGTALQKPSLSLPGLSAGDYGAVLAAEDLNGDGRSELLVSAPNATTASGEKSGLIDIFIGGKHMQDFEKASAPDRHQVRILGEVGDRLGYAVVAADVEGSGTPSLFVRSVAHEKSRERSGSVFKIDAPLDLDQEVQRMAVSNLVLLGPGRGGRLAREVLEGDIDGDGASERLWISPDGGGRFGLICVQRGVAQRLKIGEGQCDWSLIAPGERIQSAALGDWNGDGALELALGLERGGSNWVSVHTLSAPTGGSDRVELDGTGSASWIWEAGEGTEGLGADVAFGDLDGDGLDELVMGAPEASYDDRNGAGGVLVVRGAAGGDALKYGVRESAAGTDLWMRFEGQVGEGQGGAVGLLDFDGDGALDLVVGGARATWSNRLRAGVVSVVYHAARHGAGTHQLADPPVSPLRIVGPSDEARLTVASSPGDIDGDGVDDVLLLAPYAEHDGRIRGAAYVVYGRSERPGGTLDLALEGASDVQLYGGRGRGRLTAVTAVDVNGDGAAELLASAGYARSRMGLFGAGRVYLIPGRPGEPRRGSIRLDRADGIEGLLVFEGGEAHGRLEAVEGLGELWLLSAQSDDLLTDQGRAFRVRAPGL